MSAFKEWILTLCVVAVVSAVLEMCIPGGRYQKLLRLVIAAAAIYSVTVPLAGLRSCGLREYSYKQTVISNELANMTKEQTLRLSQQAASTAVRQSLCDIVNDDFECSVVLEYDDCNRLNISVIELIFPSESLIDKSETIQRVSYALGVPKERIIIKFSQ